MKRQYIKSLYEKISSTGVTLVLALSSFAAITPLFLSQNVYAEPVQPLTAATSCNHNGVLLTLQATNVLGKDALIWFNTNYGGSSEHGFPKDSAKTWTKDTNQPQIPAGTVSATTRHIVANATPPFIHVITTDYTAGYEAFSCVPDAPTITTPQSFVSTAHPTATLSWSHPNPSAIATYEYREFTNQADANANLNPSRTSTTSASSLTDNFSAVDTTLYWRLTAKSIYGFVSEPSTATGIIIVDRTAPNATITTDKSLYGGTSNTILATGTTPTPEPDASYSFTISDGTTIKNSYTGASSSWSIPNVNDATIYPSGSYTISLTVTDAAGNQSPATSTTVTIDNDGPIVAIDPVSGPITGKTVTPEVTANDPAGVASYSWRAEDPSNDTLISDPTIAEPTFSPDQAGTYTFYLTATDVLGNNSVETPFTFTWKSIIPTGGIGGETNSLAPTLETADVTTEVTARFNSTNPRVLGITTSNEQLSSQSQDKGKAKSAATTKKEKEVIAPASGSFAWYWILLILALLVAIYYAYRNWKLNKEEVK